MAYKDLYNNPSASFGLGRNDYQRMQNVVKKRSGCRIRASKYEKDQYFLSGWKYSKALNGIISFKSAPYSKTKTTTSETGKEWSNYLVTMTMPDMTKKLVSGLFDHSNHKLYIKELNLIANPKAPNGGYFGKHISRNYSNNIIR